MDERTEEKLNWILGRRSIRIYAPGVVPDEMIRKLLEAAMAAPSAMSKDPWRFVVVRDQQTLTKMAAALPGGSMLAAASAAILVCGDLEAAFEGQLSFLLQDCSAAVENLLLAAHALGLGACWVGVHPAKESIRKMKKVFGLPGSFVPVAAVSLGYPGEIQPARTRFMSASVRDETWEEPPPDPRG